jgi:O-antigen ligase
MENNSLHRIDIFTFWGIAIISLLSVLLGIYSEQYLALAVPGIFVFGYFAYTDFKKIFYLLLFFLPLSTEVTIGSFATDLPTEPIMVALMFLFFIFYLKNPGILPANYFFHPVIIVIGLHYLWIFFTMLHAENVIVSLKHLLAKTWYIVVFVLLTSAILNNVKAVKIFFWCIFIPLTLVAIQTLLRFRAYNFDFEFVNETVTPFFRNKVNYGAMLTSFYPFIWLASTWYKKWSFESIVLNIAKLFYLPAIYFSFTRMCYIALVVAAIAFIIIKLRTMKYALIIVVAALSLALGFFLEENKYLRLAPDYERTIVQDNLEDLIIATVQGEDVSSMERVYRWIAARYMFESKPWMGHGPGNFYPYYKRYAVASFYTYISDNEERSTVHNYFLLLLVEQGIIGLAIFLTLCGMLMVMGENIYHHIKNAENKNIVMACLLSLVTAYVNLFFNDMIEVDKTGSLFFMCAAMIVVFGMKEKQGREGVAEL